MAENLIDLQKQFYNTQVSVQTVPSVQVDYSAYTVNNAFNAQLVTNIIEPCLAENKVPMFVFNDAANKIGIVSEKLHKKQTAVYGVPPAEIYNTNADSAVVNILQFSGWFSKEKSLCTEIAETQWAKQNFSDVYKATAVKDKSLLTEYLLDTSICYVEVFRDGVTEKFLATRNVNLLYQLSTATKDKDGKEPYLRINKDLGTLAARTALCKYVALTRSQIEHGEISYIKLNAPTKRTKTYNIVLPRGQLSQLHADMQYRITPAFLLLRQSKWLRNLLRNNIVTLTYVKDKLQLREITTTLNRTALTELLGNDSTRADGYIKAYNEATELSGAFRVPDIALLNEDNAMRVLNLRICKIQLHSIVNYKNPYSDYDVTQIAEVFKGYLRANSENLVVMQQYSVFLELLSRKAWFDQAKAECQHYQKYMSISKEPMAHRQMVACITSEIKDKQHAITQATMSNIQMKSASELYVQLLARVNSGVQQNTVEYCKQLYEYMVCYSTLFPQLDATLRRTVSVPVRSTL